MREVSRTAHQPPSTGAADAGRFCDDTVAGAASASVLGVGAAEVVCVLDTLDTFTADTFEGVNCVALPVTLPVMLVPFERAVVFDCCNRCLLGGTGRLGAGRLKALVASPSAACASPHFVGLEAASVERAAAAAAADARRLTAGAIQMQSVFLAQMAASVNAEQLLTRLPAKGDRRGKDGPSAFRLVAENVHTDMAMCRTAAYLNQPIHRSEIVRE